MTHPEIQRRLGIIAEEICMAERWLAVALAGTGGDVASARAAFILAAKETGIFVREGGKRVA